MGTPLENAFENLLLESMQDARALQRRAQDAAANFHTASMSQLLSLQARYANQGFGDADVASSYRGSHLKKGSEVDSQEIVAEGHGYKAESQASLPITQAQHSSVYNDQVLKGVVDAVLAQVLTKLAQTTPPQSGGHAAESPTGLK